MRTAITKQSMNLSLNQLYNCTMNGHYVSNDIHIPNCFSIMLHLV